MKPVGVALLGCGHVAGRYVEQLRRHPGVAVLGVASRRPARAAAFAAEHGLRAYESFAEALADPGVEIALNLTLHHVHAAVTEQALRAGKHVYSEKPLAMTHAEARRLVALARRLGQRLGGAPATFLGEANQTAAKLIRDGRIGRVRVVYAEVNHGRIERFHPAPQPFFAVGPLWDVGVYPLSVLTAQLGPVRSVNAHGQVLVPRRTTRAGRGFRVRTPDFVLAWLQLARGPRVRLTVNFVVERDHSKGSGTIEYHGDGGRVCTGDFQLFDAAVEAAPAGRPYARVPWLRPPYPGLEYARGVVELAAAIRERRRHRADGAHAAHVVEVIAAIERSLRADGRLERVRSSFRRPDPLPWAE